MFFLVSFSLTKAKIEKILKFCKNSSVGGRKTKKKYFDLNVIKKCISEIDKTLKNYEPIKNDLVNIS